MLSKLSHVASTGSHPRVREKRDLHGKLRLWTGITPACAGKTQSVQLDRILQRDHPRVCGKNYIPRVAPE